MGSTDVHSGELHSGVKGRRTGSSSAQPKQAYPKSMIFAMNPPLPSSKTRTFSGFISPCGMPTWKVVSTSLIILIGQSMTY